ncbi:hypothetical protein CVT24_009004 [Panaeolus cyanescens]|uniref:Amidohydrolase-related domain-containing protein n=1 Tax=Panaeolus cyanescens TaxID=181874 RepID=A0A409YAL2_9AGAR|nr:hypothetical protein CVT24_009004 [Panaeolus cyanescens]
MSFKSDGWSKGPSPLQPPNNIGSAFVAKPRRKIHLRKTFAYLVAFSLAATLSILLPTPWSFLDIQHQTDTVKLSADPASQWQDNVWPIHQQTPWDISTDYPYTRNISFEVQEGTWLRLDVHPTSGDILFDMVGDLYCIPGHYASEGFHKHGGPIPAHPVTRGIPHDSDPHFSPQGDRIVFRSDAGLGVENIWVMEWTSCEEQSLSPLTPNSALLEAFKNKEDDDRMLAKGIKETEARRHNRLLREGRLNAQRVTNETYRWVSDARFHPSGTKVIATKWYTSERSLGAGEGWEYPVPSVHQLQTQHHQTISAGSGQRLNGRSLPRGWTSEEYGDQQIGPEQHIWYGHDAIIFSKNVRDATRFEYSKDVHSGIYAIFQKNLTTGVTKQLVEASPGGASRPELSRDGRTLAFVRRVRDKEALVLKDLETGSIHNVWHGLTYDLTGISAPMGTYPSFAFTPNDDAVIVWAAGKIWSVPLAVNERNERVASSHPPYQVKFTAQIEKRLAETRKGGADVLKLETAETQPIQAFKHLRVDEGGSRVVFEGAGKTYWHDVGKGGDGNDVPVISKGSPYYSPSFVPGANHLIIHARWSDSVYTAFELADLNTGKAYEIQGIPMGRYFSPVLCSCTGSTRTLAFLKSGGTYLSGDILATGGEGLYLATIELPGLDNDSSNITASNLHFIPSEIEVSYDRVNMRFIEENRKLLVQQSQRAFIIDLDGPTDPTGKPPHTTLEEGAMSSEVVVATKWTHGHKGHKHRKGVIEAENVAFVDFFHVYFAPGRSLRKKQEYEFPWVHHKKRSVPKPVWSRPGNATEGLVRLSLDGGHDITWSPNGKRLFWFLGPYLHSLEISKLHSCSSAIKHDHRTFGIDCVKTLLDVQKIRLEHETDIARLKREAKLVSVSEGDRTPLHHDLVVIANATIVTMEHGRLEDDIVENGIIVVRGGVIEGVYQSDTFTVPDGATVLQAGGAFVIPGFIDVHAHWNGFSDRYPSVSWELQTFLAYGVTTLHKYDNIPSADTVTAFIERSRVERGQMPGPRIFSVGDIIYGAGAPGIHQDIVDMKEAKSALLRIKVEGGGGAISYKNYNLPSRQVPHYMASRQRLLLVAQNMSMLCVPEGGMNLDWDLTYIVDGMTTVEHNLPVPTLYDDVLRLFALSGTGSTPTHIVNYGGPHGEQLVWATEDIPNDPKLRRFSRHDILENVSESTFRPMNSYALFNTSESVAKMVHMGLLANIGAHGEPPLGVNYHAEMAFAGVGGLTNYEVLRAATSHGAQTLGIFNSLGSLSSGKLADFLIYRPGVDLLDGPISQNSRELDMVVRGGRIYDAESLVEIWPMKGRKYEVPVINAE